jgi:acyl-CoA thioester hydrolase
VCSGSIPMVSERQISAQATVRIPFQDADPAGVVWHGNYFRYFEAARLGLLEEIDYGYRQMADSGYVWPIVDTRVKFILPVKFDQTIRIKATLIEWEYRLKIAYEVLDEDGQRATKAYTIQVAVDANTGELRMGSPSELLSRIESFLKAG